MFMCVQEKIYQGIPIFIGAWIVSSKRGLYSRVDLKIKLEHLICRVHLQLRATLTFRKHEYLEKNISVALPSVNTYISVVLE